MTEQNNCDERLARLAARSGAAVASPSATPSLAPAAPVRRRRHPALAGRIAATGIGVSTLFGVVGAFALAEKTVSSNAVDAVPAPAQPVQVVVVIHPATTVPAPVDPTATPVLPSAAPAAPGGVSVPALVPAVGPAPVQVVVPAATTPPVVLTAKPQVQAAPAPAPQKVVKTSGSK